jgi:methyl-accepting chemotaxis protein
VREPIQVVGNSAFAIKSTTKKLSTATEHVSVSVAGINKNLMTEAINMEECLSLLNNIDFLLQTSSDSTKQAASLSRIAMDRAVQGGKSVYATVDAMDKISESANKVEEIISSIQDIAAQTNLLAINTAIEAAKAGEHGKGFAVVAEEVRKLAEHTKRLILEVNSLVAEQRNRVRTGADLAKNAGISLDGIIKDVEAVSSLIQRIAAAATKQVENSSTLVSNMSKTSEVMRVNSSEAAVIAKNTEMVSSQVQKLNTLVEDLTDSLTSYGVRSVREEGTATRIPVIPTIPGASGIQGLPGIPSANVESEVTQKMENTEFSPPVNATESTAFPPPIPEENLVKPDAESTKELLASLNDNEDKEAA